MESSFQEGGFEEFLQGKADQYKLYPSDKVWESINARLHPRSNWSYLVVAALFLGLGIGGKMSDSRFAREPQVSFNAENTASFVETDIASPPVVPMASYSRRKNNARHNRVHLNRVDLAETGSVEEAQLPGDVAGGYNLPTETDVRDESLTPAQEWGQEMVAEQITERPPAEESAASSEQPVEQNAAALLEEPDADITFSQHKPALMSAPISRENGVKSVSVSAPEKAASIKVLRPKRLNTNWQVYFGPSVSYRRLQGESIRYYNAILGYSYSPDVNKAVTHKPDIGFEVGGALTFGVSRTVRFKTGIQVNVNQYDIMAYHSTPEMAPLSPGGLGHTGISAVSRYRNFNGFSKTWLKNQHIMLSLPIGAEVVLFGNNRVQFQVAGTLQPTYVLNNQAYMISTNMKNYAQEPSLYNRLNLAAGAEAYFTIKAGSYKWMIGPQVRYQLFSSYKQAYPITEHLTDYGFKIGIMK